MTAYVAEPHLRSLDVHAALFQVRRQLAFRDLTPETEALALRTLAELAEVLTLQRRTIEAQADTIQWRDQRVAALDTALRNVESAHWVGLRGDAMAFVDVTTSYKANREAWNQQADDAIEDWRARYGPRPPADPAPPPADAPKREAPPVKPDTFATLGEAWRLVHRELEHFERTTSWRGVSGEGSVPDSVKLLDRYFAKDAS